MNNVVDEVLASSPKYTIRYNDNTTATGVQIDLETAVTTQGTELNKVLFDSIRDDLNSRLLITNKATQADVRTGTNNSKYVTPQSLNSTILNTSGSFSSSEIKTIYTFDNSMTGKICITGFIKGEAAFSSDNYPDPKYTRGACIVLINDENIFNSVIETDKGFQIIIDFDAKSMQLLGDYTSVTRSRSWLFIKNSNVE